MEQKQVNIAALLQGCPKGTRLYSPICGECEFEEISEKILVTPIEVEGSDYYVGFDFEGKSSPYGECLLFPSRDVRDWGCFRVKYIVLTDDRERNRKLINLFGKVNNESGKGVLSIKGIDASKIVYLDRLDNCLYDRDNSVDKNSEFYDGEYDYILSTGTELKLEEEQPKFKVGDVVKTDSDIFGNVIGAVESTEHCCYENDRFKLWVVDGGKAGPIDIPIDGTSRLATPKEIAKWNKEDLEPNHLHYSKNKRKIEYRFLPGDAVLMRTYREEEAPNNCDSSMYTWFYTIFSHFDGVNFVNCDNSDFRYCIPYNERTAKLIGKTGDYKDEE